MTYDIEMTTDDTLELDTIIKESSIASNPINEIDTDANYNIDDIKGIQTHTGIFDPSESGEYDIHVNGQVLSINVTDASRIPGNGLYLDDWSDNKLSSRDDYSKTPLDPQSLEPSSSEFGPPIRPNWTVNQGSPNATGQQLECPDGQANTEAILSTPSDISEGTWDFDLQFEGSNTSAGSFQLWITDSPANPTSGTGYFFSIGTTNGAGPMQLRYYINGNSQGTLISGDNFPTDNQFHNCRLEAVSDGSGGLDLEIFLDGVSGGTANDDTGIQTYSTIRTNADTPQNVDVFRVY